MEESHQSVTPSHEQHPECNIEVLGDREDISFTSKKRDASCINWYEYFNHDKEAKKVCCKYYVIMYDYGKSGSTSNFIRNIRSKHIDKTYTSLGQSTLNFLRGYVSNFSFDLDDT